MDGGQTGANVVESEVYMAMYTKIGGGMGASVLQATLAKRSRLCMLIKLLSLN